MQATPQIKQIIGANIKALRKAKGLTRRALADLIDADQMLIYKWERGMHRPADENLSALAIALHVDMAYLLTDHSVAA